MRLQNSNAVPFFLFRAPLLASRPLGPTRVLCVLGLAAAFSPGVRVCACACGASLVPHRLLVSSGCVSDRLAIDHGSICFECY